MATPSAAQCLPRHIVKAIASHVPLALPRNMLMLEASALRTPWGIVTLLGVCRSWRNAAVSLFYASSLLRLSIENVPRQYMHVLLFDCVLANGLLQNVRELELVINVLEFNRSWDDGTPNPVSVLRSYRELSSVQSVYFRLDSDNTVKDTSDIQCDRVLVAQNVRAFELCVYQWMGKIRSISVHSKYNHTNDVVGGKVGNVVMHSLDCLIGPRQKTLYVHDIGLCKRVFAAGGPVLLQFISLWGLPDKPEPIALIKSCAGTLERLHISSPNQAAILKLTCEGAGTFVYPRLKHLLLSNNPEMRDSTRQQPSADPFPQLETLVCLMRYPFSSPVVLAGGQSHIRHLRLWMDADMYEVHQGVFARGAFQKLQSVSLEWLGYNDGDIYDDNVLLETSLALSAATQVVCLRSMRLTQTKEIFASVTLPDMLQSLCLDNTFLETDEIMAIFCACRALQKASVCLGDVSHGEPGYSNTHINEYHTRYDGCGTSVRYIGIWDTSPACDSTKAEAVVMLVSLLPRVVRVSVAPRVVPLAHQAFIEYLAHSRNRSIYKDRFHLDHVQFAINNCW